MKVCNVDIKKIQNEQLGILKEFDRICSNHNIKYQLMAGTLLGSVRHKGFIPWDDDIDVCLLREDYDIFLEVCNTELDSDYFLQSHKTDKNYIMQFAKIRKNNTVFLEKSMSDLEIHHGIYIDIFPLDNIIPYTIKGVLQQKILYILGRINLTRSRAICVNSQSVLTKYSRLLVHNIMKFIPKKFTDYLQEKIAKMFLNTDVKYVTHLTNGASKKRYFKYMMNRGEFYNLMNGEFEGQSFPIPINYHDVLTNLFGDYKKLPPKEQREPHHGVIEVKLERNNDSVS